MSTPPPSSLSHPLPPAPRDYQHIWIPMGREADTDPKNRIKSVEILHGSLALWNQNTFAPHTPGHLTWWLWYRWCQNHTPPPRLVSHTNHISTNVILYAFHTPSLTRVLTVEGVLSPPPSLPHYPHHPICRNEDRSVSDSIARSLNISLFDLPSVSIEFFFTKLTIIAILASSRIPKEWGR